MKAFCRGVECEPPHFPIPVTFCARSRPSHIKMLVLKFFFFKCALICVQNIFPKPATLGQNKIFGFLDWISNCWWMNLHKVYTQARIRPIFIRGAHNFTRLSVQLKNFGPPLTNHGAPPGRPSGPPLKNHFTRENNFNMHFFVLKIWFYPQEIQAILVFKFLNSLNIKNIQEKNTCSNVE